MSSFILWFVFCESFFPQGRNSFLSHIEDRMLAAMSQIPIKTAMIISMVQVLLLQMFTAYLPDRIILSFVSVSVNLFSWVHEI